jgi:hypothetical protein
VTACPRQLPARGDIYCDAHPQRLRCSPDRPQPRRTVLAADRAAGRSRRAGQPRRAQPRSCRGDTVQVQQRTRQGVKPMTRSSDRSATTHAVSRCPHSPALLSPPGVARRA